jgi:hypothetical protein
MAASVVGHLTPILSAVLPFFRAVLAIIAIPSATSLCFPRCFTPPKTCIQVSIHKPASYFSGLILRGGSNIGLLYAFLTTLGSHVGLIGQSGDERDPEF